MPIFQVLVKPGFFLTKPRVFVAPTNRQKKGSFTAEIVRSGDSYYFKVIAKQGEEIQAYIRGTDGYNPSFQGVGKLTTDKIPKGESGVSDTIHVKNLKTGEEQSFTFHFQ